MRIRQLCFSIFSLTILISGSAGAQTGTAAETSAVKSEPSFPTFQMNGRLRYRMEQRDESLKKSEEGKDGFSDPQAYWRSRISASLKVAVQPSSDLKATIGFSTGEENNVGSTNETMGQYYFRGREASLNLAYFDYSPIKNLNLLFGKMENPFKSDPASLLIWNPSLTPEGEALRYKQELGPVTLTPTLGLFVMKHQERTATSPKAVDLQTGIFNLDVGSDLGFVAINIGFGQNTYSNLADKAYISGDALDSKGAPVGTLVSTTNTGNSTGTAADGSKLYKTNFKQTSMYASVTANGLPAPVVLSFGSVKNTEADKDNSATLLGLAYGTAKNKDDTYKVYVQQRELERDSVIDAFAEADYGGTDYSLMILGADYWLTKGLVGTLEASNSKRKIAADTEKDQSTRKVLRLQLNYTF